MEVTPHLKTVLKNYQHSATKSLQGPGLTLVLPKNEIPSPEIKEEEFAPAPFPVQQVPILTFPDTTFSELTETVLEGESISCFAVGGERRLCLPQVLNSVLRDFSLSQINQECERLMIYCSRCTPEQMTVLKNQRILPSTAPSCGLITKTDAERLCSALLCGRLVTTGLRPRRGALSIPIYHECFGRARGLLFPELFVSKQAKCIECGDCQGAFAPQQFVCHVHKDLENRTVHWGFDSCGWRNYLLVPKEHGDYEHFVKILDEMQEQYEGRVPFSSPVVVVEPVIKRKQVPASIQDRLKDHELPLKKQKLAEIQGTAVAAPVPPQLPYNVQHLQQIYANLDPVYIHQCLQEFNVNRHLSAFRPVVQSIKESKIRHAAAMGRLPADPPILQNPERVVPLSESERFERTYQPNVALAPAAAPAKPPLIRSPDSTGGQPEAAPPQPRPPAVARKFNPEMELSTDTEDSASEASEPAGLAEALKGVPDAVRRRVLELVGGLVRENERLAVEGRAKDEKICGLEARNKELVRQLGEKGDSAPKGVIASVGEQKEAIASTAPE